MTYQNLLRVGGFFGLAYLLVYRENPDPTLIIALCAMMGLPTFMSLDKNQSKDRGGDEKG